MLGGTITVTSVKDKGSEFTLTTNIGTLVGTQFINKKPETNHIKTNITSSKKDHSNLKGKILLAEDNLDNQALMQLLISKTNSELDIADNGEIAVEKALSGNYDLVLMDMQMPVMDGVEATTLLRQSGFASPIIMVTANARNQDIKTCYAAGCSGFISKPIDRDKFYDVLNEQLKHKLHIKRKTDPAEQQALNALKQKFIDSLPEFLDQFKQAIAEKDSTSLKESLHSIKGMGGTFGFPEISEWALNVETALETNSIENIDKEMKQLDELIQPLLANQN